MRNPNLPGRAEQRALLRQKAQELAAQGCPRCRGSSIQVAEPSPSAYELCAWTMARYGGSSDS
jgi:hypothetical protein